MSGVRAGRRWVFGLAASYIVFVAFEGTSPLFAVNGAPPFDLLDLAGAVLVGVLCGVSARIFAVAIDRTRTVARPGLLPTCGSGRTIRWVPAPEPHSRRFPLWTGEADQ